MKSTRGLAFAAAVLATFVVCGSIWADPVVLKGTDYLQTADGTTFMGIPMEGVPIGGTAGPADTEVMRLADVSLPAVGDTGSTDALLAALQLRTVSMVNLGAGLNFYYVTLQSARVGGGTPSRGMLTITLKSADDHAPNTPEGTFSSFFDVFFDIHVGSLTGPIVDSADLTLTSSGNQWDANPMPGTFLVPGPVGDGTANWHTGKGPDQMDFFPLGEIKETHPDGSQHLARVATVPEPGGIVLMLSGFGVVALSIRRARKS